MPLVIFTLFVILDQFRYFVSVGTSRCIDVPSEPQQALDCEAAKVRLDEALAGNTTEELDTNVIDDSACLANCEQLA